MWSHIGNFGRETEESKLKTIFSSIKTQIKTAEVSNFKSSNVFFSTSYKK